MGRGRDRSRERPPAQIRTGRITAYGSYLGLRIKAANRCSGQGWRMRAGGSQALAIFVMRSQVSRDFWLRRRRVRYHSRAH